MTNTPAIPTTGRLARAAWLLPLVALLGGCGGAEGPPRAAVEGRVAVDGRPLPRGSITFAPTGATRGPEAAAEIIDGHYQLDQAAGPMIGALRVEIHARDAPPFPLDDPRAHAKHPRTAVEKERLPARYNRQSTLTVTTTADGPNRFDFDLTTQR